MTNAELQKLRKQAKKALKLSEINIPHMGNATFDCKPEVVLKLLDHIDNLEEIHEDKKRLTKEIDKALNGRGAAKQASLCDILCQIQAEGIKAKGYC